jgi:hypothetical protein
MWKRKVLKKANTKIGIKGETYQKIKRFVMKDTNKRAHKMFGHSQRSLSIRRA